jgi:ABC-type branched-subunit amino acid transport system substrate-binding protein
MKPHPQAGDGSDGAFCVQGTCVRASYAIGLLYSTTGPYGAIGREALDGAMMALAEINADDAFGFTLAPVAANPEGVIDRYHTLCEAAIREGGCRQIVGTITSLSRKEVLPTIEKHDALLWYICPYEGFESSEAVIYTGASPNQHIVPLFQHVLPRWGTRAALLGSNYIWGWEVNRVARELIGACGGEVLAERYLPIGSEDVGRLVQEVREKRPDFILNILIGPSSYAFFRAYRALADSDPAFGPDRCPIVSCNLTECELGLIGPAGIGHLSSAIYFEGVDTAENRAFRDRVRQHFGAGRRSSAFLAGGYAAVRMLAEAIREAGTDAPEVLRPVLHARRFATPLGPLGIDPRTNHAALTPCLGRIRADGGFEILDRAAAPVAPDPYLVEFDAAALARRVLGPGAAPRLKRVT